MFHFSVFGVHVQATRVVKSEGMDTSGTTAKMKCSAKSSGGRWAFEPKSCQRSWQKTGRCNWISGGEKEGTLCIPNCNHVDNQNEEMCEASMCFWYPEKKSCHFKDDTSGPRRAFCAEQTEELKDWQASFCEGSTTLSAFVDGQTATIDYSKLSK